jgi:hypothetical protein
MSRGSIRTVISCLRTWFVFVLVPVARDVPGEGPDGYVLLEFEGFGRFRPGYGGYCVFDVPLRSGDIHGPKPYEFIGFWPKTNFGIPLTESEWVTDAGVIVVQAHTQPPGRGAALPTQFCSVTSLLVPQWIVVN